jgi:hypothetical protein
MAKATPQYENRSNGCGSALPIPVLLPDDNPASRIGRTTTKQHTGRRASFFPNPVGGKEEPRIMSYLPHILTLLMVLSPLFIPVGVHVVHAIRTWRPRQPVRVPAISRQRRRLELAIEFD